MLQTYTQILSYFYLFFRMIRIVTLKVLREMPISGMTFVYKQVLKKHTKFHLIRPIVQYRNNDSINTIII